MYPHPEQYKEQLELEDAIEQRIQDGTASKKEEEERAEA